MSVSQEQGAQQHDEAQERWSVAPGYEPVRDLFAAGSGAFGRGGGAYTAYVGGRKVVDVWTGRAAPDRLWHADTTAVLMSATKGWASMCAHLLADRGLLDVEAPVASVWPEFAQNGKAEVTIRQVLTHTAGLLGAAGLRDVLQLDGAGWHDHAAAAQAIAEAPLLWPAGTKHGYHAVTVGFLVAEIVRRVDGRTLGRVFAEEIAGPLGLTAQIGTSPENLARMAQIHPTDPAALPRLLRGTYETGLRLARDPDTLTGLAFLGNGQRSAIDVLHELFTPQGVLGAELAFGGGTSTARDVARSWALMAGGGELDGVRLLSEESVARWSEVVVNEPDVLSMELPHSRLMGPPGKVPRTLGYFGNGGVPGLPRRFGPNPRAYGAEGLGGQYGFADPDDDVAVGYVRNDLVLLDVFQPRLTEQLYACAARRGEVRRPRVALSTARRATRTVLRRQLTGPQRTGRLAPGVRALSAAHGAAVRLSLAPGPMGLLDQPTAKRQAVKPAAWMTTPLPVSVRIRDEVLDSRGGPLRVRLFRPAGLRSGAPSLLYVHGGGFVLGGLDAAAWICAHLAEQTGALVASVEYRLAPEDPFPAALEDAQDALSWLRRTRPDGVDPSRVAVAGDSAGGNLSAALCLLERGSGALVHQVLIYPFLDATISSGSWRRYAGGGVDPEAGRQMVQAYAGEHAADPLVSPLHADDLTGLPPATIVLAECDVLHDDGLAYAQRLKAAGVPVTLRSYDAMPHGFLSLNRLCREAPAAVRAVAADLRGAYSSR